MKKRNHFWINTTSWRGLFFFATIFLGCNNSENPPAGTSDSVKSFTALTTSAMYSGELTREEYKGKLVYDKYCQVCHGRDGDGKGFNAFNLQNSFGVQPADFTDSTLMTNLTTETIITVIAKGGKAVNKSQYMPPWGGTLKPEEVRYVVSFIHTFVKR